MTTKIKIERGVPIPSRGSSQKSKYPFEKMEIGDSFAIPNDKKSQYSSLYQASRNFTKNNPEFKFTLRKDETNVRIWRIKKK